MTIWMKQMKRKTREAQATYAPNLESTCLEYCRDQREPLIQYVAMATLDRLKNFEALK